MRGAKWTIAVRHASIFSCPKPIPATSRYRYRLTLRCCRRQPVSLRSAPTPTPISPPRQRRGQLPRPRGQLDQLVGGLLCCRSSQITQNPATKSGRTTTVNQTTTARPMPFSPAPTKANARRLRVEQRSATANANPTSRGTGTRKGDQISQPSNQAVPGSRLTATQPPMAAVVARKTAQDAMPSLECPMALLSRCYRAVAAANM